MSLGPLIATANEQIAPRAKSLIVTVFGDSIVPHGGRLWMGSLIRLMAPLGINERLVRTAVQRLTVEDWLRAEALGRRSCYGLTDTGAAQAESVYQRIYAQTEPAWDGQWRMLLLQAQPRSDDAALATLRQELGWLGFGGIPPNLYVHPGVELSQVQALLRRLRVADRAVLWQAALAGGNAANAELREQVLAGHDMDAVAAIYAQVLALFGPIERAMRRARQVEPELAFCARTLLIHLYRRALLRDPQFPDALMPADWPGAAARHLCRDLYRLTSAPAQAYLRSVVETPDGLAPPADKSYRRRFGGLDDRATGA